MDENNDLDVTESGGQFNQAVEKAKSTTQTTKKAGSEIKKLAKKKLKNTKNIKLKKSFEAISKIASKLGPLIPYIIIAIVIIIVVVGLVAFLISMPGMLTGKLEEFGQKVIDKYESLFVGKSEALVNDDDIVETANYLKSMGYDLIGYGFIPANKSYSHAFPDISQLNDQGYTDLDGDGIFTNDSDKAYEGKYISDSGIIYDGTTGQKYDAEGASIETDQYGITYTTTGDETGAQGTFETSGQIISFSPATDVSLIKTYLMSDMKTMIIRNFDQSNITKVIFEGILNGIAASQSQGMNFTPMHTPDNKWAYGIVSLYNAAGGLATSTYKAIQEGEITISNNIMTIKGGWGSNPIEYNMDGWIGRYGLSLEFLLSLHLSTMSPELVDTITRTYNTDIQVYLDEMEDASITAYFRTDDGKDIIKDQLYFEDDDGVISNKDAFKAMKEYGIKSKGPECTVEEFRCKYSSEPKVLYLNGESSGKSFGKVLQNSNNYEENVIEGKGEGGTEEYVEIRNLTSWTDVEASASDLKDIINETKLNNIVQNIKNAINTIKTNYPEYTNIKTEKTVNSISDLEDIIPFEDFRNETNTTVAKQCEIFTVEHPDSYNNGTIKVELLVYRTSTDHNWDMAVLAYKEVSDAEKNDTESNNLCSNHFEDGTITEVCGNCENYVESIRNALTETGKQKFKGQVPYIARVLEHWFRDVYFVIPTDEGAEKDVAINGVDPITLKRVGAYTDNKNYGHGKLYGTDEGKIKLSGTDIELVTVDDEYKEDTGEHWSQYVMNDDGTYRLYVLDSNGEIEKNINSISNAEAKNLFDTDENGVYLKQENNEEDVEKYDIKLVKKTITTTSQKVSESSPSTLDTLVWTAYNFGSTASQEKNAVEITDSTNEDIKKVSLKDDGTYEDRIFYSLNTTNTVAQADDGQRGITNSTIKKMFKNRKYYMYDGTSEKAEAIYEDWQSVISGKDETEVEKAIDDLYYGTSTSTISYTEDPRNPDLIGNIDINADSLNAFSILENIHTQDAEYAYRDFKELIVELNYFDREDLSDKIPEVFTWVLPELQSTWPIRVIDKSENYYGTYIHSNEAIKTIKDKLGITEDEDGEVTVEGSEDTESTETISKEDAQILNSAKGYDYAGEVPVTEEETSTEEVEEDTEESEAEEGSEEEGSEELKAAVGEVISPVTGEVIAYGTYERINTDLVKYEELSEEDAKEKVGYIQIKVMNDEKLFDFVEGDTEVSKGKEGATEKYSNAEALNAFYEEYEDICEGYIVTIDGIKLLDGVTVDAKGNGLTSLISLSDDNFKVTESFEANITANLVDDDLEEANQQKENAKAAAPAVAKNAGKIYVREGTIIGYTTKNENSKAKDYSYMRVILRAEDGSERENVENYFDMPDTISSTVNGLPFDGTLSEEGYKWLAETLEGGNLDATSYRAEDIGDGTVTAGPGVTNHCEALFKELGYEEYYPMVAGQEYPADVILDIYYAKIEQDASLIQNQFEGITFSENEMAALIATKYQRGSIGEELANEIKLYKSGNGNNLESVWTYVPSDFAAKFPGVVKRRQAEYELFTTGNYVSPY